MREASCLGYGACEHHERSKTQRPTVACGIIKRAGPHAEPYDAEPIRHSVGRKVASKHESRIL
jgi:hypothetical protein